MNNPLNLVRTGPRGQPPVVLLHAVGLDLTYWGEQIEALRRTHDVIAYDLPGHGRSPGAAGDWSWTQAADTLAGVIRSSGAEAAQVVGLSAGGMIAQTLALRHPALVKSLTLINTAASFPAESRAAMRARAQAAHEGGMAAVVEPTITRWFTPETVAGRPDLIDRVRKTYLSDDPSVYAAIWAMIATLELVDQLHALTCPALVLVGELDPTTPPATAAVLTEHIAGAVQHIIADASHMAPLEKPAKVNARLLAFLRG